MREIILQGSRHKKGDELSDEDECKYLLNTLEQVKHFLRRQR